MKLDATLPNNWLSALLIISLLIAFIILWDSPPKELLTLTPQSPEVIAYPTTYLTGVKTIQYSPEGKLDYEFKAQRLSHFQSNTNQQSVDDYTLMEKPDFIFHSDDQQPWLVTAESGRANFDGSILELSSQVRLWQTFTNGDVAELTSDHLVLKPGSQFAETAKPVIIRTSNSVTKAVGMKAFLEQDRIQLLSNVRSVYDPAE